jgi:hypothetical protein
MAAHPRSVRELARLSGLGRATVSNALAVLLIPALGLVEAGPFGASRWYGHRLRAVECFDSAKLNDADARAALRALFFDPELPNNLERYWESRQRGEWLARVRRFGAPHLEALRARAA